MTNRQKINQMSDKELAMVLNSFGCFACVYRESGCAGHDCLQGTIKWLNCEVKEK